MDLEDDLMTALRNSDINGVLDLLSQGACLNFLSDDEEGPLHVAVAVKDVLTAANLTQILLAHSASADLASAGGVTALHLAAGLGRPDVVHLLLAHGADPETVDVRGRKAKDYLRKWAKGYLNKSDVKDDRIGEVKKLLGGGSYSDVSISFQRYVIDHEQEDGGESDKENRIDHQTPITKFLDNVQDIFLEDVTGVKGIDDCEGEAAVRQQKDLDDLLLELEELGFKTPTLRKTMSSIDNMSSNSQRQQSQQIPSQHEITSQEKVLNFLDNMEEAPSNKSTYQSTPMRARHNSNVNLKPPDISTSTIQGNGDSLCLKSPNSSEKGHKSLDESCFKTPTRSFMMPTQSSQRRNQQVPKQNLFKTPVKSNKTPVKMTPVKSNKTPVKSSTRTPVKITPVKSNQTPVKNFSKTPLKNTTRTPVKISIMSPVRTPSKNSENKPAVNPRIFGTLSSKDSFHTANTSMCSSSHASIATTLANASLVSVAQEFLYKDDEKGVSLVEVRLPSVLGLALQDQELLDQLHKASEEATGEKSSLLSCGSSMGSTDLRAGLGEFGEAPVGPITQDTRRAYLRRLKKLRLGLVVPTGDIEAKFPGSMSESLKNISCITRRWAELWELEKQMSAPFSNIDSKTVETVNFLARDAAVKSSFNYLLLDPRITQNLPSRVFCVGDQELWRVFVSAVFYIGKGTRSRPFQHLYEASKKKGGKGKFGAKIDTIHGIWEAGMGVISLQVFQNTIGVEGFTREAAMIQAMGCKNLSNAKPGDWYGPSAVWAQDQQTLLGTFLLFRAFKIFLQEGERQIRPVDLKL